MQIRKMKLKNLNIIIILVIAGLLIWEQSKEKPSVWIQVIGVVCFFYGMMRLSAKTPSKNQDNEE
jgi:glucose uptake protein GlcU